MQQRKSALTKQIRSTAVWRHGKGVSCLEWNYRQREGQPLDNSMPTLVADLSAADLPLKQAPAGTPYVRLSAMSSTLASREAVRLTDSEAITDTGAAGLLCGKRWSQQAPCNTHLKGMTSANAETGNMRCEGEQVCSLRQADLLATSFSLSSAPSLWSGTFCRRPSAATRTCIT